MTEGIAKGRTEGEQKLANLVNALLANGETDKVALAMNNQEYRDTFYKKYNIV